MCLCCRPLCPTPAEFISHCFLCTGIYDVTANISFVLRWRISQGSCPYGVKQTANMDRLWLRSWGWVDIMVAVRELHLKAEQFKKNRHQEGWILLFTGNHKKIELPFVTSYANGNTWKSLNLIFSLCPRPHPLSLHSWETPRHIKMKTRTFPGSQSSQCTESSPVMKKDIHATTAAMKFKRFLDPLHVKKSNVFSQCLWFRICWKQKTLYQLSCKDG